jgi:hypothetical protein
MGSLEIGISSYPVLPISGMPSDDKARLAFKAYMVYSRGYSPPRRNRAVAYFVEASINESLRR